MHRVHEKVENNFVSFHLGRQGRSITTVKCLQTISGGRSRDDRLGNVRWGSESDLDTKGSKIKSQLDLFVQIKNVRGWMLLGNERKFPFEILETNVKSFLGRRIESLCQCEWWDYYRNWKYKQMWTILLECYKIRNNMYQWLAKKRLVLYQRYHWRRGTNSNLSAA